uniref:Uncharacterized protein n=1 Tax=Lepeophtheirus salmonis TaxID=72036 RepID=A0A0K2TB32_LEPSM
MICKKRRIKTVIEIDITLREDSTLQKNKWVRPFYRHT